MAGRLFVNDKSHVDHFKCFIDQLTEFINATEADRVELEKSSKQAESLQAEADATFEDRIIECKEKSTAQRLQLEATLRNMTEANKKFCEERKKWAEQQKEAHEELMQILDEDNVIGIERQFGEHFAEAIQAMKNLAPLSMNEQLTALTNSLDSLKIENKQLEVSIADQLSTISGMAAALSPTCGVAYTERNALRIMIRNQVIGVRTKYQESRLLEESLKAKLGN